MNTNAKQRWTARNRLDGILSVMVIVVAMAVLGAGAYQAAVDGAAGADRDAADAAAVQS